MGAPAMCPIRVIELFPHEVDCYVCGNLCEFHDHLEMPIYEDEIVPDNWDNEWGGVPVCRECYEETRHRQALHPGECIPIIWKKEIRSLEEI